MDSKRRLVIVGTAAALGLGACARAVTEPLVEDADPRVPTIDIHSHAGRVIPSITAGFDRPFVEMAEPMRAGGMDVVCLAVVADTPVTRIDRGQVHAVRQPEAGELYAWSLKSYARARVLIDKQGLATVTDRASMRAATGRRRSVIVASEGADFLEGRLDRGDEFYEEQRLRHLQLTHYRVNELGDIQTAYPVHGGLTAFGRAVVERCNRRGIVVDVAHAPIEMVRGVVEASNRPIVLSHTSLSPQPAPLSRLISPDHARLVASTGGVIGIWPPASRFPSMGAYARGIAAMIDVVGVDHVGLGTDMLGLTGPSVFGSYAQLPALREALNDTGLEPGDVARICGGNYARVFEAVTAA
jgi:membrane dipeptidase